MQRLALGSNHLIWGCLSTCLAFWLVAPFLPVDYVFILVNAMSLAVAIGIVVAYLPRTIEALVGPVRSLSGGDLLIIGIDIAWASNAAANMWAWAYRGLGKPDMMVDSMWRAWIVWILFLAGFLHLVARGAVHGHIPSGNWIRAGAWIGTGLTLAGLVITYLRLNAHPIGP
jgi:hypothetical protein